MSLTCFQTYCQTDKICSSLLHSVHVEDLLSHDDGEEWGNGGNKKSGERVQGRGKEQRSLNATTYYLWVIEGTLWNVRTADLEMWNTDS